MQAINKINSKYNENKIIYVMVLIFFTVGIALGTYMVKYMDNTDLLDLSNYFSSFSKDLIVQPVNKLSLFLNVIKKNLILISLIILFGISFFGTPIILLIDLIKGFLIGYTFSFLLTTFNGNGKLVAIIATLPQNLIYIPCFIALSIISIEFSSEKLKNKFFSKHKRNTIIRKEIILRVIIILLVFLFGTLIESFVSPMLIKIIIGNLS